MQKILVIFVTALVWADSFAYTQRNVLQSRIDSVSLRKCLSPGQSWVPYPDYGDRAGWDSLTGKYREDIVRGGEVCLDYEWKVVKAMDYIDFEVSGDRSRIQPEINRRLRAKLKYRELDSYLVRNDFWWMGFDLKPGTILNNWNPWCNSNALLCFMLLEDDSDRLFEGVWKTIRSVDTYLNFIQGDGAIEEGPTYWAHAAGKLFDYVYCLNLLTGGKYRARDVYSSKGMFRADISGAYPEAAAVRKWVRSYAMKGNTLRITDEFKLQEAVSPNEIVFMTARKPLMAKNGVIGFEGAAPTLVFSDRMFAVETDTMQVEDPKIAANWGERIYRLRLVARKKVKEGKYAYSININN